MKKLNYIFCATTILLTLFSCTEKDKNIKGKICSLNNKSLAIISTDGIEQTFNLENSEFSNGAVMIGDSVNVTYTGNLKKNAKATTISLIIQPRTVIQGVDESKPIITR